LFGNHTFFLDGSGLNVLEPAEMPEKEVQAGEIVSLASWSDETLTSLRPREPEPTGIVVVLESRHWLAPHSRHAIRLEWAGMAVLGHGAIMQFGRQMFWCSSERGAD
jgi:hypothetical protein